MQKQLVILDTSREAQIFLDQLKGMPYLEEFFREAISTIIEYMGDSEYAPGSLLEYISESVDLHEVTDLDGYDFNAERHRTALKRLGTYLYNELIRNRLYTNHALWFEVSGFLGHDVVLREMTKEDLVN